MIDRNLFLHDLAIVAIMKNEGHYLKEWLDYHLLAGVDHFYIYDNESSDNQAEVAKPYVAAGLVDYFHVPGKAMQCATYNDAVNRFKFQSRYMAFVDGDEFIFPKTGGGIVDIVDEIFSEIPDAGELSISWQCFGSNGHETADYSRGVLERFTRRESEKNPTNGCKCIANPRRIKHVESPHWMVLFEGILPITERKEVKTCARWMLVPPLTEKIVVNHYHCKSWEEYSERAPRGDVAAFNGSKYTRKFFEERDFSDVFDDGILKYRYERAKSFRLPDKSHTDERLLNALTVNLSPTLVQNTPPNFYAGKMETFLTCRAVAAYLKTKLTDSEPAKIFEEASLKAILKSVTAMNFADARLLISELPNLLQLPYPAVNELRNACLQFIPQIMDVLHMNFRWMNFVELDYIRRLLQLWRPQ